MPIDIQRVLEAAIRAALEDPAQAAPVPGKNKKKKKRGLTTGRAVLLGAGLVTAGRVIASHKGRDLLDNVQQRIASSEWLTDAEPDDVEDVEEDEDVEDVEDVEDYDLNGDDPEAPGNEEVADEDEEVDEEEAA